MSFIIKFITPVVIAIAVGAMVSKINKDNGKEILNNLQKNDIKIHLPKMYVWVGYICMIVFTAFILIAKLTKNDTMTIGIELFFILLIFVGFIIVAHTKIWKIQIYRDKDYFLYKTLFRKTCEIKYADCISYKYVTNGVIIQTNTKVKKIGIDQYATNFEFIICMLDKYNVKEITAKKRKHQ